LHSFANGVVGLHRLQFNDYYLCYALLNNLARTYKLYLKYKMMPLYWHNPHNSEFEQKLTSSGLWSELAYNTVDQRRILFYKKLIHHSSIHIRNIARLCQYDILSIAAKCGIYRLDNSVSFIKKSVWKTFAVSVV